MMKKILAVVVALVIMSTLGMVAFAAETPTEIPEIVLELDRNGAADGKMEDIVADENGLVVVPEPTFINDNYNFTGWNTSPDGAGFSYNPGDEIVLKESLTLYAQWLHKGANWVEFTITYDANGGKGEVVDVFGPYLEGNYAYTAYCDFYKKGATFVEWNTKADGTGDSFMEDEMFEIYENMTLYAIWDGGEDIEEPGDEEPAVSDTNTNPNTGSTSAAAAVVAGVVALGALVVLKKRG